MKWKQAGLMLLVLVLSTLFQLPVKAQEQILSQTPSVTVTLHLTETDELPVTNRDFRLIPVDPEVIPEQDAKAAAKQARELEAAWFKDPGKNPEIRPSRQTQDTVVFQGLKPGLYLVSEGTPGNYRPYEPVLIRVEENKSIDLSIKRFLPSIVIRKTNEQGKAITNKAFTFGVFTDTKCTQKVKSLTAELTKGVVKYIPDRYQTIYIKEIKAPSGYQLSSQVLKVEFREEGIFVDGQKQAPADGFTTFEISYVNKPDEENPPKEPDNPDKPESPDKPDTPQKPNTSSKAPKTDGETPPTESDNPDKPGLSNKSDTFRQTNITSKVHTSVGSGVKGLMIAAGLALTGLFGVVLLSRNEKEEK